MAKTLKAFRLSEQTLTMLAELKSQFPHWTETQIVERAIDVLNALDLSAHDVITCRSISGVIWTCSRSR